MQQSRIFVGMVLILIFAEVLGLYGYAVLRVEVYDAVLTRPLAARLIVALILNSNSGG
jgi:ABC-type transporter Mla maintaining outer membrane lipid asymmetry permease subunit MlaE